jgi:hypothetical protein
MELPGRLPPSFRECEEVYHTIDKVNDRSDDRFNALKPKAL